MKLDSHQHFWNYDAKEYNWIENDMLGIRKDFKPQDLYPILKEKGFDGTILVQARQSLEETEWLLNLAKEHSFIKGVVGWIDLCSRDVEEQLRKYSSNKLFKGVRHVLQDEDDSFILDKKFMHGIASLEKYNLAYDILIGHKQLPPVIELVERFPNQKFVLDHIGKPDIKNFNINKWREDIRLLSLNNNVYCKLSGMVTEADWLNCKEEDFKPYLDVVFDCFGIDRLMIGSDWPVCTLSKDYSHVMDIVENYISSFSQEEKNKILGKNCYEFYQLKDSPILEEE